MKLNTSTGVPPQPTPQQGQKQSITYQGLDQYKPGNKTQSGSVSGQR